MSRAKNKNEHMRVCTRKEYAFLYQEIVRGMFETKKEVERRNDGVTYFNIISYNDNRIFVEENVDNLIDRRYIIYNLDNKTEEELEDFLSGKIYVTESCKKYLKEYEGDDSEGFFLDTEKLVKLLARKLPREVYMNLNKIIFICLEEDCSELEKNEDLFGGEIIANDIPGEDDLLGKFWYVNSYILINVKNCASVIQFADCFGDFMNEWNRNIMMAILHELRHLEQNNTYIPEEVLSLVSEDIEEDAKEFAFNFCARNNIDDIVKKRS